MPVLVGWHANKLPHFVISVEVGDREPYGTKGTGDVDGLEITEVPENDLRIKASPLKKVTGLPPS